MIAGRSAVPILVTAAIFVVLGLLLSPDRLASVGLMDKSLASGIPLVRATALLEISIAKRTFLTLGALFLLIGLFWPAISNSGAYKRFMVWDLNPPEKYERQLLTLWNASFKVLLALFALSALYLAFGEALFSQPVLDVINMEDGVIETAQAVFLLIAAIQSLRVAIGLRGMASRTIMHLFLTLLFLAMLGEEISWGQRYFGFETPENLKAVNVQGEINIHNMFGYLFDHLFILFFFLWGCVVPILFNRFATFRQMFRTIGLPIPSIGLAVGMLFITLFQEQLVYKFTDGMPGLRIPEMREFLSMVAFILLMNESFRGLLNRDKQP